MNQYTRRAGHPSVVDAHPVRLAAMPHFRLRPTIVGLAFVAAAATAPALHAQTTSSGSVTGASGGGADLTIADAPGSVGELGVRGAGTEFYADRLQVGVSGTGRLNVVGGAYLGTGAATGAFVGVNPDGVGIVTIDGQGSWLDLLATTQVGAAGSGSVVVSDGGRMRMQNTPSEDVDLDIGVQAGAAGRSGSVTVTGKSGSGNASRLDVDNDVRVGMAGTGRLEVSDGAQASIARDVTVGTDAGGDGTLLVDRGLAALNVAATTVVGNSGTGRATVSHGGALTTSYMTVGSRAGGKGDFAVSDAASRLFVVSNLLVGDSGTGTVSVLAGASASAGNVYIGQNKGSIGTVRVDGQGTGATSTSTLTSSQSIFVGDSGTGALIVADGGQASARANIIIANDTRSVGTLSVTGTGSTLTAARQILVGSYGTGSMRVGEGGILNTGAMSVGGSGAGRGEVTVNGTGSKLSASGGLVIGDEGIGELQVGGGGAVVASSLSLGNDPAGAGGNGSGAVTVDGAGATLTVNGNTVVGDAGRGSVVVSDGGTLAIQGGRLQIGERAGSLGGVTVTGENAKLGLDRGIRVGNQGTGLLEVSQGAQASTTSNVEVGVEKGSVGTLIVTGPSSRLDVESATIGRNGTGSATVSAGGTLATLDMSVGFRDTASGTVTVDGENSLLAIQGPLKVGQDGKASLLVANAARATVGEDAVIGVNRGGGVVTVTGAKSQLTVAEDLIVGQETSGALSVLDAARVEAQYVAVGQEAAGSGAVKVAGAGSLLKLDFLTVADAGSGTVEVSGGGSLSVASTELSTVVGARAGARGSVLATGAGSSFRTATDIQVGESGIGSLRVVDGAQAFVGRHASIGTNAGSDGTVAVAGASSALRVQGTTTIGASGAGRASVDDGGALITGGLSVGDAGSGRGDVALRGAGSTLSVSGGMVVGGAGVGELSVLDGARADAGSTTVGREASSSGALTVGGASSRLSVGDTATIGDAGSAVATVRDGGHLATGDLVVGRLATGVGTVTVDGVGSLLEVRGALRVGLQGNASLTVSGGAQATAGRMRIGPDAGGGGGDATVTGTGTGLRVAEDVQVGAGGGRLTLTDGGGAAVGGTMSVGQAGLGIATVERGGGLSTGALWIGATSTGPGDMKVDGVGSLVSVARDLEVGRGGTGTLTVSDGARVTSSTLQLGRNAGGIATVRLTGAGSSLTTGDMHFGRNDGSDAANPNGGISTLTVTEGATLHAASGLRYDTDAPANGQPNASTTSTGTLYVATSAGSTATLNVGADAAGAAAAPGTIDARRIVFGQGKGFLVFNHTAQDLGFAPTIEGAGRVQALAGTTTLASGSTYHGGTSITGATLRGSATSFGSGAIHNDGALVIDQAADAVFANVMSGTGTLTKTGAGRLDVTGDASDFTGATVIAAGRLAVNGSLAGSMVTAQAGTTLSGSGTVGGVLARAGSTVAPGNSPGTLTVAGDYRQAAGATYVAEVVPGGMVSDLVAIGGTATLERGAVIRVAKYGTGGYAPGTRYTVLSAAGGVQGTYVLTGETDVSAFYALETSYDARHVYLDTVQVRPFVAAARTINQTAAADGVQSLGSAKGLSTAIGSLRTDEDARRAFDQLSGELHASARTVFLEDSRFVREATRRQVHASGGEDGKGAGESAWAHAYGSAGRHDGDGNAAGFKRDIGGLFVGTDTALAGGTRLGIVGGYGRSRIESREGRGSATVDTYGLGLYGATGWDRARLSFGADEAWHRLSTSRPVSLTGFADPLSADYHARTTQFYGDIGYRMGADLALAPAALEPFASLAWVDLRTPAVQEKGGAAALGMAGGSTRVGFATLGARSAATLEVGGVPVVASALLGWRGVLGGTTASGANHFAGAAGFVVQGVPLARHVAAVEANVSAALTPLLTLGLSYAGQIGSGFSDHGVKASLAMKF